jgi:hypothetical protein
VESRHLQGCSPYMCRLRTDGLASTSKYWTYQSYAGVYRPSKPSNRLSTEAWLFPTASLAVVGEKLGMYQQIGQLACYGFCRQPFFSGLVDLFKSVDDCAKGCYALTTWNMYGSGPYTDCAWDACGMLVRFSPLQGVHRFESPWLSNMSNRLSHGSLQIANEWINIY